MKLNRYFPFIIISLPILLIYNSIKYRNLINSNKSVNILTQSQKIVPDAIEEPCSNYLNNDLINKISIEVPKSKQWQSNIIKAFLSVKNQDIIIDKFKKSFDAFISYPTENRTCINRAKIKISGDVRDHIENRNGNLVTSLDIKMETGNINGVRLLKLFLPNTRHGENEVFVANLFSQLGLLSPRTKFMDVEINNIKLKMIFQEKLAKELVENNMLRESALIKLNDKLLWNLRRKGDGLSFFNAQIFPAVVNTNWIAKGETNLKIAINALNRTSFALDDATVGYVNVDVPINISFLSNNKKILSDQSFFSILSAATRSLHLNYKHNRRYYYDPFYDSLIPVYYDGDSKLLNSKKSFPEYLDNMKWDNNDLPLAMLSRNNHFYDFDQAIKRVDNLDINSFQKRLHEVGLSISIEKLRTIKNEIMENINYLDVLNQTIKENPDLKQVFKKEKISNKNTKNIINKVRLVSGKNFNDLKICDIHSKNCVKSKFSKQQFYKISNGNYKTKNQLYFYSNRSLNKEKNDTKHISNHQNIEINKFINMKVYGNPDIIIEEKEKKIKILYRSNLDKIIIYNSNLIDWNIEGKADIGLLASVHDSRIDAILVTGSLVIQDSKLNNVSISFENGIHEDSINIIRSEGTINKLLVKDSFQDSIDLDFSHLLIDSIKVEGSGNDCLDLSGGKYRINNLFASQCSDKAISVGEKSNVHIENFSVDKSAMGIVIKDSSKANIENAIIKDSDICLAMYRKKQEFSGSYLTIPHTVCDEKNIFIQKNSIIKFL